MQTIMVPKENVNDEEVTIVKVFFENGSKVTKDETIFEIETTKVNIDIDAPVSGNILHSLSEGDTLKVGETLCKIDDGSDIKTFKEENVTKDQTSTSKIKISKAALQRAKELDVDLSKITKGMITINDVEKMADNLKNTSNTIYVKGKKSKNSIVIVGGGGHARTCIDILKQSNEYEIVGIIDPKIEIGTIISGIQVIGDNSLLKQLKDDGVVYAVNGVGSVKNPLARKHVYEMLKEMQFELPNLIHSSCSIESSASIGEGNQFMMGSMIGSDTIIKNNCLINSGSVVSHDCVLHNHCHIAPGAILAGSVEVGEISLVGMGSTIYIGVNIGKEVIIYNGINVFNDVKDKLIIEE